MRKRSADTVVSSFLLGKDGWLMSGSGKDYDIAQICLNGHVVNAETRNTPEKSQPFCEKCGERSITVCERCNAPIRGQYGWESRGSYSAPSFCLNCGQAFPWLELRRCAAIELVEESDDLSTEEKQLLTKSIDDIIRDSPNSALAATRFKRLMAKMGKTAAEGSRSILVDIITEAAKKVLWP